MKVLERKDWKFLKNSGLGTGAGIAGGVAGALLTDLFTDSKAAIAICSTAVQYAGAIGTFSWLHARDNPDIYRGNGIFRWRDYIWDMAKLNAGFAVLDYLYVVGRPFVNYWLLRRGYDPSTASLLSDAVCIPMYWTVALPVAKALGVIRERRD
ncbi:MAG: hypothetical protein HYW25_00545 [Candidatus Aenigmarchaeota archaeon]|nr:hypothetical protein [Candidatus Aenigmarchaeota archaeon]